MSVPDYEVVSSYGVFSCIQYTLDMAASKQSVFVDNFLKTMLKVSYVAYLEIWLIKRMVQ